MKYKLFYHDVKTEYFTFTSAGIEVTDSNGKCIKKLYDVSTDFASLKKLLYSLNENDVSLEHLDGILQDYYIKHY